MDAYRDWGHAEDYVKAMHLILQQPSPGEWVVATGETHSVREMCEYVFNRLDLNYKDYVIQNPKFLRPEELPYLKGDSSKLRNNFDGPILLNMSTHPHLRCDRCTNCGSSDFILYVYK